MSENPLLELMRRGESGAAGYNAYNRGTYVGADGRERIRGSDGPIDFSQLTLGQVQELQHLPRRDPDRLFAVGKYQIIPSTMDSGVRALGLDPNERFTPELQDRIFSEYLIVQKRPAVHDYITGKPGATLHAAQRAMAMEWASFGDPDKDGRSYYGGANRASITPEQSAEALNQMRTDYRTNIDRGMSPGDAWRAVTTSGERTQSNDSPGLLPADSAARATGAVLREGSRSDDVRHVQDTLNRLGYRDAQGNALAADGDFGPRTREAVLAFQQANGLRVDGIVGPQTLGALGRAGQMPLLSDPLHPNHAMYQQAVKGLEQLGPQAFNNRQELENAAGTLVFDARVSGLTRIDHVVASTQGTGLFAVQGRMDDPVQNRAYVDKAQAVSQPLEQSTRQLQQENLNQAPQEQQEREQRRVMVV
ncbi:peptidoglycan-binding domain-containing protein [Pseudoxanthomonas wuyuanensis]|uniref:Peptidoglycan binding domain-containing protein n=1 Tax=Pseudoxanthomonas wuyuanensis TaxID=1073196 RepID=A0A286DDV1_9GAMM|nr:XVIPCD domain-containing protein [Pseudoxanthomonas wuyuanensis]SOD56813.1 Putative peptidoglycan binding domain-containing protein [Pseudoxanthomonas wuyuanensis]